MGMQSKKLALCGILTALALALSLAERWIPLGLLVPVPGIRLGLANIVTMFALLCLTPRDAAMILLCRVGLASVFAGSITSFLFGILGGSLALVTMWLLLRWKDSFFSLYGISVAGAAMHNIGQIAAAAVMLKSLGVVAYLPLLLITAIPMGLLTAAIADLLVSRLRRIFIFS